MKIITERDEIRTVAERWKKQYGRSMWANDPGKQEIARQLEALDKETADRWVVAAIIGNDSWIDTRCDSCGQVFPAVIHIGDEQDYDARWQVLCEGCLKSAADRLQAALALIEKSA
jgi:hypothetical protein